MQIVSGRPGVCWWSDGHERSTLCSKGLDGEAHSVVAGLALHVAVVEAAASWHRMDRAGQVGSKALLQAT